MILTYTAAYQYLNVDTNLFKFALWAIQVLHNAGRGGGINFSGGKRYEGVGLMFNVISVTRGG